MNSGIVEVVSGVIGILVFFGVPVAALAPALGSIALGIEKSRVKRGRR